MRAYYFGNFYLSSIQQGIQALHVTTEMYCKYNQPGVERDVLQEWAEQHKTVILLNGGMQENLDSTLRALTPLLVKERLPFACFNEERAALNGAFTSFGMILPDSIYDYEWNWHLVDGTSLARYQISEILKQYNLAV